MISLPVLLTILTTSLSVHPILPVEAPVGSAPVVADRPAQLTAHVTVTISERDGTESLELSSKTLHLKQGTVATGVTATGEHRVTLRTALHKDESETHVVALEIVKNPGTKEQIVLSTPKLVLKTGVAGSIEMVGKSTLRIDVSIRD